MSHPYSNLAGYARWNTGVRRIPVQDVDPVTSFPFRVRPEDRVVTAGSCFAQHIARGIAARGFTHYVAEPGHRALSDEVRHAHNYGIFSARYGNIYTARQLLQLIERAKLNFIPVDVYWRSGAAWVDPFRPTIQPGGFATNKELLADREQHLASVARALRNADVFVFTLGLTEAWVNRQDGAVYPLCPGVAGGVFDRSSHAFKNFSLEEVESDLRRAITLLREFNPAVRVIITVSPVPLAATAEDRHVLISTTLSKAVLRLAAETICHELSDVAYFPSYEIISESYNRGIYFAADGRSVTEPGVSHVMEVFFRHVAEDYRAEEKLEDTCQVDVGDVVDDFESSAEVADVLCDEELLAMEAEGHSTV